MFDDFAAMHKFIKRKREKIVVTFMGCFSGRKIECNIKIIIGEFSKDMREKVQKILFFLFPVVSELQIKKRMCEVVSTPPPRGPRVNAFFHILKWASGHHPPF